MEPVNSRSDNKEAGGPALGRRLAILHEGSLVALLTALVLLEGLQVLLRFVFSRPLVWPEEFASLLLLWLAFIGAAFADRQNSHVAVTILLDLLPSRARRWLQQAWLVLTGAFLLLVAWQGWLLVWMHRDVENPALGYSVAFGEAALPVGALLGFVLTAWKLGKGLSTPHDEDRQ